MTLRTDYFKLLNTYADLWRQHRSDPLRRGAELESLLHRLSRSTRDLQSGTHDPLLDYIDHVCEVTSRLLSLPYGKQQRTDLKLLRGYITDRVEDKKETHFSDLITKALDLLCQDSIIGKLDSNPSTRPEDSDLDACIEALAQRQDDIRAKGDLIELQPWEDAVAVLIDRWHHRLKRTRYSYLDERGNPTTASHVRAMSAWREELKTFRYTDETEYVGFVYPQYTLNVLPRHEVDADIETIYPTLYRLDVELGNPDESQSSSATYVVRPSGWYWVQVEVPAQLSVDGDKRDRMEFLWELLDDPNLRAVSVCITKQTGSHNDWKNHLASKRRDYPDLSPDAEDKRLVILNRHSRSERFVVSRDNVGALKIRAGLMTPLGPVLSPAKVILFSNH